MKKTFQSNGKLLLTGEYVVLDGATALAIPTKYGQSLEVEVSERKGVHWQSFTEKGAVWFEGFFDVKNFETQDAESETASTLAKILREARNLNPDFLLKSEGITVKTKLDFPRNWGLGTSSTLINNIAQWANVNPFKLLKNSFGGSGYDIAAAQSDAPILYELENENPKFKTIQLSWDFKDALFFVHLNQKQDSKEGISHYRNTRVDRNTIQQISEISNTLLTCPSLSDFEDLMNAHEGIISEIIKLPTIKEHLFNDYPHTIKSLGAWGGDFVLVTGREKDMGYFRKKGFDVILPFEEMIL
ncbi:GYDIA family GHMP kinase [Aequorivita marisscotiae]|uniref:GYDIA family GHMP kinase n=1 Tax=Aequorivita marisscotiae TaxID=3040348 RepID=A0ABY8KY77_9FLAO|nr:GYDIA family GHMP kinase [Aequorivita sp. Ant34-E75]WGF93020.1 GYDIA family GHMP kinase [Aequorivita sp. Ant34-E75]